MSLINNIDDYLIKYFDRSQRRNAYKNETYHRICIDPVKKRVYYQVFTPSDIFRVEIFDYDSPGFYARCNCYYGGNYCHHIYHSLLGFRKIAHNLDEHIKQQPLKSFIGLDEFKKNTWSYEISDSVWSEIDELILDRCYNVKILPTQKDEIKGIIEGKGNTLEVKFIKTQDQRINISCQCGTKYNLCEHQAAAIIKIMEQFGPNAFDLIENHESAKKDVLKQYGIAPGDPEQEKFQFFYNNGKLCYALSDLSLSPLNEYASWQEKTELWFNQQIPVHLWQKKSISNKIAYVWNYRDYYNRNLVCPIVGKIKKNGCIGGNIQPYSSSSTVEKDNEDQEIINFSEMYKIKISDDSSLDLDQEAYFEISKIFHLFRQKENYFQLHDTTSPRVGDFIPIIVNGRMPEIELSVTKNKFFELTPYIFYDDYKLPLSQFTYVNYGLLLSPDNQLLLIKPAHAQVLSYFDNKNSVKANLLDWEYFYKDFLIPLSEKCVVSFDNNMKVEEITSLSMTPEKRIYFSELDNFFLLTPSFYYSDGEEHREVEMDNGESIIWEKNNYKIRILRDRQFETDTELFIKTLHPKFENQFNQRFYHLPVKEVLESGWFFEAFEKLQKHGFEVFGLKNLKTVSYTPHRPRVSIRASSGIDWYDLKVNVYFGDVEAKLSDIRKALYNREKYVKLHNGQLGMLPDDWIEKYSSFFKAATIKKEKLQLNKFQYTLIDDFVEEIDNNKVFVDLAEKIQKLRYVDQINKIPPPQNITAVPRSYQVSGFQWLHFLNEISWGGCLADDMGLGKTLQVLMLVQQLVNTATAFTALLVVPRSLVFNWIREIEKFAPELKVLSYAESNRTEDVNDFKKYHLVITTYGLVRSDIGKLKGFVFDYIILDESQAIKNPVAQISKAVKMLKSRNRLILTGTPIENNTFDLYSQMDFLNPGMLGSIDTFRREYANKIDKDKDAKAASELKRLVYPFMLSRKKEEVAKELPDKSETILYCEMEPEQRKVYDYFKKDFAEKTLQIIEEQGLGNAGIYILQGLLKLRQICNSPRLLSDGDYGKSSVKLDILREEIPTITGRGEKVLIFSFFVEMLDLISKELDVLDIGYEMLTGGSVNREKIVERFKHNKQTKVFLISLKAGGFGLNLTEANYVFLVDPWWNPAVEQQAFDRTHRIGQTRKVFTYKLICKGTIEEKILLLQEKKKSVAKEIITVDAGFFKSLKKEDVQDLFS